MPWNLIDHSNLLRWSKIKKKKVLTGPKGTSLHVSAGLVWSLAPLGVTRLILCSYAGPQLIECEGTLAVASRTRDSKTYIMNENVL
jgi:hypothetical protein